VECTVGARSLEVSEWLRRSPWGAVSMVGDGMHS